MKLGLFFDALPLPPGVTVSFLQDDDTIQRTSKGKTNLPDLMAIFNGFMVTPTNLYLPYSAKKGKSLSSLKNRRTTDQPIAGSCLAMIIYRRY
ncbi:MAG: hypothetical protein BGO54_02830 [Sphingobacteriales bacterium 46-32]|nr:MAG: hypothetical protein BGO54_02830 [Sphingobacteriales bacterium 46-32]